MAVATAAGTDQEVEVKLDAGPEVTLPDLTALPGVVAVAAGEDQHLEAVYLDSADLRLLRHGTTLRRRTGGSDAGWHLKLPAPICCPGQKQVRDVRRCDEQHQSHNCH